MSLSGMLDFFKPEKFRLSVIKLIIDTTTYHIKFTQVNETNEFFLFESLLPLRRFAPTIKVIDGIAASLQTRRKNIKHIKLTENSGGQA